MADEFFTEVVTISHITWVLSVIVGFLWTLTAFFVHRQFLDWFWVRSIHLISVVLIALLPRFGMNCPLSTIELYLRIESGSAFTERFALHYLRKFIYEGIGPAFIEVGTLVIFLGTLAVYLYRPPKRVSTFNWLGKRKSKILVERGQSAL